MFYEGGSSMETKKKSSKPRSKYGRSKTKKPTKSKKATGKLSPEISPIQWGLPAGYKGGGEELATLREVVDPSVPTLSLADLKAEKRKDLIVSRLELEPDFTLNMIGAGVVDKARAIEEVKAQTPTGKIIQEIEQRVINNMLEKARLQKLHKK